MQTKDTPSPNRDKLRIISTEAFSSTSGRCEYATAVPPTDKNQAFDTEWFNTWYEEHGHTYLKHDPRKKEDRYKIAEFNGFEGQWNEFLREQEEQEEELSNSEWIYMLALHYSKFGNAKHHIYSGIEEGMHRSVGLMQAAMNAVLCTDSGMINPYRREFTAKEVIEVFGKKVEGLNDLNISNAVELITTDLSTITDADKKQDLQSKQCMVNDPVSVKVYYMNREDANVPLVMKAIRKQSESISNDKRTSSHRSISSHIGDAISTFLRKFDKTKVESKPDTSKKDCFVYSRSGKDIQDKVKSLAAMEKTEDELYPLSAILASESMKNYINDPFDMDNIKGVEELLSFPDKRGQQEKNKVTKVTPPYYVDYSTLSLQPTRETMTGEIANAYILVPTIMHIIWAGLKNKVVKTTQNDEELQQLIIYTLKYHCGGDMAHQGSYSIHSSLRYCCPQITTKKKITCGDSGINPIGATLTIVFMVNAAIGCTTTPHDMKTGICNSDTILKNLKRNKELLHTAFYKMEPTDSAESVVFHFGENSTIL